MLTYQKQNLLFTLLSPRIDSSDNNDELALKLAPYAEMLLSAHPNDKALCRVMHKLMRNGVAKLQAYANCVAEFRLNLTKAQQKYYGMDWSTYFDASVKPLIPTAKKSLKHKTHEQQNWCLQKGILSSYRNPIWDAVRQVYLEVGQQYCPKSSEAYADTSTAVDCVETCVSISAGGLAIDCIEKCKLTPDVLFKPIVPGKSNTAQ